MANKVVEIKRNHVKEWVVKHSKVNNPFKKYWSAAVTIGYDHYGKGDTIEQAYNDMTDQIFKSPNMMNILKEFNSFRIILGLEPKNKKSNGN